MAKIVMGIGMSHSPMMAMHGSRWNQYAENDYKHPMLFNRAGQKVTYEELEKAVGAAYVQESDSKKLIYHYDEMRRAYDRLYLEFQKQAPDVVLVIANDHPGEWFDFSNVPALAVFYGEKVISAKLKFPPDYKYEPDMIEEMAAGMGMDEHHKWPGHKETGLQLITSLIDQGFDVAALQEAKDPAVSGHGHAFGMVVTELMREKLTPMVPIYLNAWPPNELSPSRCYDLGLAIRKAVESMPEELRIGIIASGGLSHFVTDTDLDQQVLAALRTRDEKTLRSLPKHLLNAGNSEIRNWISLEGAIRHLSLVWDDYIPVYRTPAGTGIGMTFAYWS